MQDLYAIGEDSTNVCVEVKLLKVVEGVCCGCCCCSRLRSQSAASVTQHSALFRGSPIRPTRRSANEQARDAGTHVD